LVAEEEKIPPPVPVEAQNADLIAGVAITACCVVGIVVVAFDVASIKESVSFLVQNIRTISGP